MPETTTAHPTFADVMELGEKVADETIGILSDARSVHGDAKRLEGLIRGDRPEGAPANVAILIGQAGAVAETIEGAIDALREAAEDAGFLFRSLEAAQAAAEAVAGSQNEKGGDN